VGLPS
jgi:hypothetical protein